MREAWRVSALQLGSRGLGQSVSRFIVLCPWERHSTFAVPISSQDYKRAPTKQTVRETRRNWWRWPTIDHTPGRYKLWQAGWVPAEWATRLASLRDTYPSFPRTILCPVILFHQFLQSFLLPLLNSNQAFGDKRLSDIVPILLHECHEILTPKNQRKIRHLMCAINLLPALILLGPNFSWDMSYTNAILRHFKTSLIDVLQKLLTVSKVIRDFRDFAKWMVWETCTTF